MKAKLLVPTDFTEEAHAAIQHAVKLGVIIDGEVILLNVVKDKEDNNEEKSAGFSKDFESTKKINEEKSEINTLMCFSLACSDKSPTVVDRIAYSNKIFLPESILYRYKNEKFPIYFKLSHPEYGVSCVCGVEEFTGTPGCVLVPHRVMEQILLNESENVVIEICYPLKGTYIKLRPRKTAFIDLPDPKSVLETYLSRDYPVVSVGDTISIKHCGETYHIDVMECRPGNSIDILNTDVNLDFDTPADYVEHGKADMSGALVVPKANRETPENRKIVWGNCKNENVIERNLSNFKKNGAFVPFSGKGYKLGNS